MKGKKLFSLLLVAVLSMSLFLFTACSGDEGNGGGKNPPAHVHSAQHTAALAPTCNKEGHVEYWYCLVCGKYFSDEDCTEEITKGDITLSPTGHKNVEHVTRHEATCTEDGNKEYYHCLDCNKYFSDSSYQTEITGDITLPAGHKFPEAYETNETEHWKKCENCEVVEQRASHDFGRDRECDICGYELPYTPGLRYENIDSETCKVTGIGTATATEIIIPATYDGRTVVEIGSSAFRKCTNLRTVTFAGDSKLESIGFGAFEYCNNLTSIKIPSSVTTISGGLEGAFMYCTSLQTVTFDDDSKLESIGAGTFSVCSALTEITIPASVISIGGSGLFGAFSGCANLQTVIFADDSKLQSIGDGTFSGCSVLTEITIPANVTSIGDNAFYGCTNLQTVNWNATNCTEAGVAHSPIFAGSMITTVNIGENVENIPAFAFRDSNLTSITISAGVTSIGYQAFYGCYNLIEICNDSALPIATGDEGYGGVGKYAKNIYSSEKGGSKLVPHGDYIFYEDEAKGEYRLVRYTGNQTEISLPEIGQSEIEHEYSINMGAFVNDNVVEVTVPASVIAIGGYAFSACGLSSITIPASVIAIGEYAFYKCTNLQTVTFAGESKLKSIGDFAFSRCSFTEIIIPASVTSIGSDAFYQCDSLQSATFENPNGWRVSLSENMSYSPTTLSSGSLRNKSTAAGYLRNTYCQPYWKRS